MFERRRRPGTILLSRLNSLAYALPCQRFADTLANNFAWLGDDVVRYTFTVGDLHPLLHSNKENEV